MNIWLALQNRKVNSIGIILIQLAAQANATKCNCWRQYRYPHHCSTSTHKQKKQLAETMQDPKCCTAKSRRLSSSVHTHTDLKLLWNKIQSLQKHSGDVFSIHLCDLYCQHDHLNYSLDSESPRTGTLSTKATDNLGVRSALMNRHFILGKKHLWGHRLCMTLQELAHSATHSNLWPTQRVPSSPIQTLQ